VLRVTIPVFVTAVTGGLLVLSLFMPVLNEANTRISVFFDIIAAVAFILGGGNLTRIHLEKIQKRGPGWWYSIVTLVGFFFTLIVGLFKIGNPGGWTAPVDAEGSLFNFAYDGMYTPLMATTFSILAFFVASASYRAFRARNVEATLLLVAALIILLGRTFVGVVLTSWIPARFEFFTIPNLSNWIMSTVNLAGQRAIMIGIGLGVISTSLKIILGIERSYLGGGKES